MVAKKLEAETPFVPTEREYEAPLAPIDLKGMDVYRMLWIWFETEEALSGRGLSRPRELYARGGDEKGIDTRLRDWLNVQFAAFSKDERFRGFPVTRFVSHRIGHPVDPFRWSDNPNEERGFLRACRLIGVCAESHFMGELEAFLRAKADEKRSL